MPAIAPYTKICLEKRNRKRPFPQKKYEGACLPRCHTSLEMITALRAKITQPMEKTRVMSLVGGLNLKKGKLMQWGNTCKPNTAANK